MTEKELIARLRELKQITPRKDWVVLAKTRILESSLAGKKTESAPFYPSTFSGLSRLFYQRKLVYSLAVVLFVLAGVAGVSKYESLSPQVASQNSSADIVTENTLKNDVEDLKNKSQNLAQLIEGKSQNTLVAIQAVKDAARNVTDSIKKDPQLARVVALDINNSRSLLDIPGGDADIKAASDDVFKTIDDPIIASVKETKLTPDQQMAFDNILSLYDAGRYSDALVGLLISFGKNGAEGK